MVSYYEWWDSGPVEITETCSRCGKIVLGWESILGSAGFYRVDKDPWFMYAQDGDSILCDSCMFGSPLYQENYLKPCQHYAQKVE